MQCQACGTANEPGRKFCGECGAPLAVTCPTCGAANAPGVKFCGECGTDLRLGAAPGAGDAQTPTAERRLVSILFADLVGFTTLVRVARRRDGPRPAGSLLRDGARRSSAAYGGTVEKFIGDAVMAVWGAPTAFEDDAERAVRSRARPRERGRGPRARGRRRPPVARRRPDRRGGRDARRHEPGHGRRRPGQHRVATPVGRATRDRPRRRGDLPGRVATPSLSSRRASTCSRARPRPSPPIARSASSPDAVGPAATSSSRRRSSAAARSCGCSRTSTSRQAPSGGRGLSRSSARAASARAGWSGNSRSTSTV